MLQAIRSKATSFVVKILFGLLIVTFGIWGIGDIFRGHGVDTTVATVGDRKIDAQELSQVVRQDAERWRSMLRGATLDTEQLKQLGIVDTALQRLINRDLVDLEIRRLHLAIGDEAVRQAIMSARAFQNGAGQFDRNLYNQFLANQRKSEPQFEAELRTDMIRGQLNSAVAGGAAAPAELVDTLYRNRAERRTADILIVPSSAAGDPGKPSDADLAAFYEQHQDDFRVPELRSFSVGLLRLEDVAASIKVPEEKLRDEYQSRLAEFHTPEQRRLQQILLPDEAKAKEAQAQLAAGKDFAEVAKTVADAAPDTLDLGFFGRDDLPPKLAEAAFSLKAGEVSPPIQDNLGWHILRVAEIKPEETKPFEAVKDQLATEVARDMAGDQIAKAADQIEDALAGGSSFADVVQRFGLKLTKVENVDANGRDADGKPVELPQPSGDILKTAFGTASGQTSQLNDLGGQDQQGSSGYYLLQVDKVTPAMVKPLDQVRDKAAQLWQAEKHDAALQKLAKDIADEVNGGKKLADIAAERKFTLADSGPLLRSGGNAKVPPAVVPKIFDTKPGMATFAKANDGYVVAQVKEVLPPDPAKEKEATAQLETQLSQAMQNDLQQQFDAALRQRYPVDINETAVQRVF